MKVPTRGDPIKINPTAPGYAASSLCTQMKKTSSHENRIFKIAVKNSGGKDPDMGYFTEALSRACSRYLVKTSTDTLSTRSLKSYGPLVLMT